MIGGVAVLALLVLFVLDELDRQRAAKRAALQFRRDRDRGPW